MTISRQRAHIVKIRTRTAPEDEDRAIHTAATVAHVKARRTPTRVKAPANAIARQVARQTEAKAATATVSLAHHLSAAVARNHQDSLVRMTGTARAAPAKATLEIATSASSAVSQSLRIR